jgi:phosphoglycolate phosphatase
MIKLALFDFDGTIIDSAEGIVDSVLYALSKIGIVETDREKLLSFIGPPLFKSFKKHYNADDDTAHRLVALYREFYAPTGYKRCSVYDGIPELLAKYKDKGIINAVASAKPEIYVKEIIKEKGLDRLFDVAKGISLKYISSDKIPVLQAAIDESGITDKDEIIMIGDRKFDIEAARKLGIKSIGVTYGFGTREELEEAKADIIVDTVEELSGLNLC